MQRQVDPVKISIGTSLAQGWRLFLAGFLSVFPWVLAAELLPLIETSRQQQSLLTADLGQLFSPLHLAGLLLVGILQAWLYAMAIVRLPGLAAHESTARPKMAVWSMLSLFIAYLIYELIVYTGAGIALLMFLPTALLIGPVAGILVTVIPLAPTAYISTAFALFAYPAVLERKGPFAALGRSLRLTRSNWGRTAVVISVPAIALLLVAAVKEVPFFEALRAVLRQTTALTAGGNLTGLQKLLSNPDVQRAASPPLWRAGLFSLMTALCWWYALAACYAEYRELNQRAAH